jgi:hypothetical protein
LEEVGVASLTAGGGLAGIAAGGLSAGGALIGLLGPAGVIVGGTAALIALGHATGDVVKSIKDLEGTASDKILEDFFVRATKASASSDFAALVDTLNPFSHKTTAERDAAELVKGLVKTLDDVFASSPGTAERIVAQALGVHADYAGALADELAKLHAAQAQRNADLGANIPVEQKSAAAVQQSLDAINSLFKAEDTLASARSRLNAAGADEAKIQQQINDLIKVGATQEIAEGTQKLTDAHDTLTAAFERQAIAQKALDDLNTPATDRELSDASDAITEAQIRLAQAIRARDAAEKALHKTTGVSLNLAHLSLDQLRTTLANARATLATQRTSTTPAGATPEETALLAEIDVRHATEAVGDAQAALLVLQDKGKVATDATREAEHELTLAKNATVKAQDEVNKRQGELNDLQAGNTQFQKDLNKLNDDLATAKGKTRDAQVDVNNAVIAEQDQLDIVQGKQVLITGELRNQLKLHQDIFKAGNLQRSFVESLLTQGNVKSIASPLIGIEGLLSDAAISQIFAALLGDPSQLIVLLKSLGLNVPGHERGALVTSPSLAWIGEKFRPESVIPWSRPDRVWEVLAQSLPHMTPTVRQRLEPVLPGPEHRISAPTHLSRPVAEFDYEQMATALAKALREYGLGADVDINVTATPGMSESQLARKMAREMGRYFSG